MEKQTQLTPNRASLAGHRVLDSAQQNFPTPSIAALNQVEERRLSPGEWLRAVEDFRAPFGFDRMPTIWG